MLRNLIGCFRGLGTKKDRLVTVKLKPLIFVFDLLFFVFIYFFYFLFIQIFSNVMLHRLILSLQVHCPNDDTGCRWTGEVSQFEVCCIY